MRLSADTPLPEILSQLKNSISGGFESATPIPAAVNHSPDFAEHEKRQVFMQEWICVGREDELTSHGQYLTQEIAGVSVIVVRRESGELGAFLNSCAHRRARLLSNQSGRRKSFTCPYHGWTYDCDGDLVAAPHMEMKPEFKLCDHSLKSIPVDTWEGFVYVSLADNPDTELNVVLRPLQRNVVGRYGMPCYQTVIRQTISWNANWKNLIENFTESYHVPIAHKKTFAKHAKPLTDYRCSEDSDYYGYHLAPQKSETGAGAAHPGNTRLEGKWRRTMVDFCVFPSHLITLMPDYLWWISVHPHGPNQFVADWGVAVPPEVLEDVKPAEYDKWINQLNHYIDIANEEDRVLVEALHQGSVSADLPVGTYHPIERNLWQFNRYLARICAI